MSSRFYRPIGQVVIFMDVYISLSVDKRDIRLCDLCTHRYRPITGVFIPFDEYTLLPLAVLVDHYTPLSAYTTGCRPCRCLHVVNGL